MENIKDAKYYAEKIVEEDRHKFIYSNNMIRYFSEVFVMKKIEEINNLIQLSKKNGAPIKDISDGHHTFNDLYKKRTILICSLCNAYPEISWKSKKHFNEENDPMFKGDFIVGINTRDGIATFHIKMIYWDIFDVPEVNRASKYDNYTSEEVMNRLLSLKK